MAQFCIHQLIISLYFCFLAAAKLLDVSYCFSSLRCTVLTAQMHMYCHKPLTVADTHHSGTGYILFHRAISLLPGYNEKRINFAPPFKPVPMKTTGQLAQCLHTEQLSQWPWLVPQRGTLTSSRHTSLHPNTQAQHSRLQQVDIN